MATAKTNKKEVKSASSTGKFAVIQTGGKQYLVREGESLRVEKIKGAQKGDSVDFNDVLLTIDGDSVKIGNPTIADAKVTAKAEEEGRSKKITILKYKPKTRYKVKKGHRQTFSKIKILEINS